MKLIKVLFLLLIFFSIGVQADTNHNKFNEVKPEYLLQLEKGEAVGALFGKQSRLRLKTEDPITKDNFKTIETKGIMIGLADSPESRCQLEIHAFVKNGQVDVTLKKKDLIKYLDQFKKLYGDFGSFSKRQPTQKRLKFHEEKGFEATWEFGEKFQYRFDLEVGADEKGKLENKNSLITAIDKFIKKCEKDKRSKIILANNKSGLPIYVAKNDMGEEHSLVAQHPMHLVKWDEGARMYHYSFLGDLNVFKDFPEVKKISRDKDVKKFIGKTTEGIRIKGIGDKRDGFQFLILNNKSLDNMRVELVGGAVKPGK